ncbi:NAD(P)-dependent oxidoreductase [Lachnospiraceae bacterium 42-17]|jgi:UDP-glucuronate decarboxylase|nr:NAD(P)-dependent oxidoreductase [Dorea sp.]
MCELFKGRCLLTGATGYIGSMISRRLLSQGNEITVIVRDAARLEPEIYDCVQVIQADMSDGEAILQISGKYDYVIHCAAPTKSAYMVSHPVEVTESIVNGTKYILELARRCGAKSVVYVSSMEVYGQIECSKVSRVTEEQMGYIDITDSRSCYPLAKLMAEGLCHFYYKEYEVPVKIARLAQTFGRGVRPDDNRVFAQFAGSVRNGTDIVLHTAGNSMGNYCDIDDTVDAILFILLHGKDSEAYNVVNEENTMSIREMAELVAAKMGGGSIKVTYNIPEDNRYGYAADTGLWLSGKKLKELGWEARRGIEEMYRRMLFEKSL